MNRSINNLLLRTIRIFRKFALHGGFQLNSLNRYLVFVKIIPLLGNHLLCYVENIHVPWRIRLIKAYVRVQMSWAYWRYSLYFLTIENKIWVQVKPCMPGASLHIQPHGCRENISRSQISISSNFRSEVQIVHIINVLFLPLPGVFLTFAGWR